VPRRAREGAPAGGSGAGVEAVTDEGLSSLAFAATTGSPRVFDTLLQLGADFRSVMTVYDAVRRPSGEVIVRGCALHTAAHYNDTAILRGLLAPQHRAAIDIEVRTKQQAFY
jgi:hypothetical protein